MPDWLIYAVAGVLLALFVSHLVTISAAGDLTLLLRRRRLVVRISAIALAAAVVVQALRIAPL